MVPNGLSYNQHRFTGTRIGDIDKKMRFLPSGLTNNWGDREITNKITAIMEMRTKYYRRPIIGTDTY